jgi:hypothetical protein
MDRARTTPSLLQVAVIAIVGVALLAFLVISFNTGDLLWFLPTFNGLPANMVVHCYGQDVVIEAGNPSYQAVNEAVNSSLSGSKRWDSLSMSDITYEEYQTSPSVMVIELRYDPPTRIHSIYKFYKNVDTIVIPLDGRHASTNAVFGHLRGYMIAGSLHVDSMEPIVNALAEEGICQIQ